LIGHLLDADLVDEALGCVQGGPFRSGEVLETLGHMSLAILNNHRDDADTMARLLSVWRAIAQRVLGGPVVRAVGRGWTLNLLLRPLIELMKRQPAYQPFNTREMAVTFARDEEFRRYRVKALECLEKPEAGIAPIVEILETPDLPFDVYLMLVMERALICAGTIDLDKTFDTIEQLFKERASLVSAIVSLRSLPHPSERLVRRRRHTAPLCRND
jgi:hypothetical protein